MIFYALIEGGGFTQNLGSKPHISAPHSIPDPYNRSWSPWYGYTPTFATFQGLKFGFYLYLLVRNT